MPEVKSPVTPDTDMEFGKAQTPPPAAPQTAKLPEKNEVSGKQTRRVIIGVGQKGETGPVRVPDPDEFIEGKWVVFDRGMEVDLDTRTIGLLKTRCTIERERNEETGEEIVKKFWTYPVSYADNQ